MIENEENSIFPAFSEGDVSKHYYADVILKIGKIGRIILR